MRAVLFDMDGVVVDSERYWEEREREELLPETVDADVDVDEITGMNVEEIYEYLAETYPVLVDREGFLERFDEVAREIYTGDAALLAGLEDLLAALDERDAPVGLVSSSPVDWIDVVREEFSLEDAFDAVVSADHVDRGKPAPDVYLRVARQLGVDPADCVAVEDSRRGVEAAKAAGAHVVGLLGAANDAGTLADADEVVEADELPARLLALVDGEGGLGEEDGPGADDPRREGR